MRFILALALTFCIAAVASAQSNRQPQPVPQRTQERTAPDQRGTDNSPVVVRVLPTPKTAEEAAEDQAKRDDESSANWWMVRLTGLIAIIGLIQAWVFWKQAGRLKETIDKMDEIAQGQTNDMQDSITQASRAAVAMEGVANSMAENVENLKVTVGINREIADRQKLVTELQSRAYLSVQFYGVVPQNTATGVRFEPRVSVVNLGNTPAYNVVFRTAADVLPLPLPEDFAFPLPAPLPNRSVSTIGPRLNKILHAVVPKIYPDVEVEQLKGGVGQRIYMWGEVLYRDAFNIDRYVRFSHSFFWLEDGKTVMSSDTARHNDAN
jgi:hypothetical protein